MTPNNSNKIYVGDVGTEILVDCVEDISQATKTELRVLKPDKTEVVWLAVIEGATKLKYIVQPGDIDQAGLWVVQAYVELPNWKGRGESDYFEVFEHFK